MEKMFAIMLQNLGLNPKEILEQVKQFAEAVGEMKASQDRTEANSVRALEKLDTIERHITETSVFGGMTVKPAVTIEGKSK